MVARRNARSQRRATSRWLVKRIFPSFENLIRYRWRSREVIGRTPTDRCPAPSGAAPRNPICARLPGGRSAAGTSDSPSSDEHQLTGALRSPRGRGGRSNDVLDAVAGTCSAVVARRPPTIGEAHLGEGVAPVLPQEIL